MGSEVGNNHSLMEQDMNQKGNFGHRVMNHAFFLTFFDPADNRVYTTLTLSTLAIFQGLPLGIPTQLS